MLLTVVPAAFADAAAETEHTGESGETELSVETGAGGIIRIESESRARREPVYSAHVHSLYESRYVTEGRDNLPGSGLLSVSSDISIGDNIAFIPWGAYSSKTDYAEINLNLLYVVDSDGPVDLYAAYNHIQSEQGSTDFVDNEIEIGVSYLGPRQVDVTASTRYSFDAEGSFVEITAFNELTFSSRASLRSNASLGYNAGYITDGHRGLNHFMLKVELSYFFMKHSELTTFAGYNIPIDRDAVSYAGDTTLREFFWSGIGLSYYFR